MNIQKDFGGLVACRWGKGGPREEDEENDRGVKDRRNLWKNGPAAGKARNSGELVCD